MINSNDRTRTPSTAWVNPGCIRELLRGVVHACSNYDWGEIRKELTEVAYSQKGSTAWMVDQVFIDCVRCVLKERDGRNLIALFEELRLEYAASPLIAAIHVVMSGEEDSLEVVEPEIKAATLGMVLWLKSGIRPRYKWGVADPINMDEILNSISGRDSA